MFALSRKCTYRAKISAGVTPLTSVDSGFVPAENLTPLVYTTGKYSSFFRLCQTFFGGWGVVNTQCVSCSLLPFAASSQAAGQTRALDCRADGGFERVDLDGSVNKSLFPVQSELAD